MSSLTISMIVCVDCQPCSSIAGLNARIFARPVSRLWREVPVRQHRAIQIRGLPLGQILGIDLAEVTVDQLFDCRAARRVDLRAYERRDLRLSFVHARCRIRVHRRLLELACTPLPERSRAEQDNRCQSRFIDTEALGQSRN